MYIYIYITCMYRDMRMATCYGDQWDISSGVVNVEMETYQKPYFFWVPSGYSIAMENPP